MQMKYWNPYDARLLSMAQAELSIQPDFEHPVLIVKVARRYLGCRILFVAYGGFVPLSPRGKCIIIEKCPQISKNSIIAYADKNGQVPKILLIPYDEGIR